MRPVRLILVFLISMLVLTLLFASFSLAAPSMSPAPSTLIPMGTAQTNVQRAYLDVFAHLYDGGRVHRAASALNEPVVQPGDFIIPGGLTTPITHTDVTVTLPLARAYALHSSNVAVLRSTVMITDGQNQLVAMWELADVRQFLDGYLMGRVPYTVLDEQATVAQLHNLDVLIIPSTRADAIFTVTNAFSETGALAAIRAFAENGGTVIAQSNGAYVAEAAGLLPAGTVDLTNTLSLSGADPNRGELVIQQPDSPLAWSWLTTTLYILNDPLLHPTVDMQVIATLSNANDAPAIVRAPLSPQERGAGGEGVGQVILFAGHPANDARRAQAPLFIDALLSAFATRAEITGDAIQIFNPAYPAHEFPAYERVPISATLNVANHWDIALTNVIVTETVQKGYVVSETTITPAPTTWYTTTSPTSTVIVWNFGELAPNALVTITYEATTEPDVLAAGVGTFSTGEMSYLDPEQGEVMIAHPPFVLTAQMAARLVGDRDLEADRHYRIPAEGLYLDMALSLENKEWTLAHNVVVTDWVFLIHPIVDLENQHVILNANDGETIWVRNEPFLWGNQYVSPTNATAPTQTYTLDDWQGDQCVFTSTYGIHIDPPANRPATDDLGSFITIPPTYSQYITVTANHELLLPCLPLTFDIGPWPGYWYEEPAVRFGVHSRELFSRTVVFHGTPREDTVVMPYDAGSIYVVAGTDPVPFREYLTAAVPYVAASPSVPGVTYQDVWSRTHVMPLRGSFYDVWDWDSCATCGDGWRETHAAMNITFGLLGNLDRVGNPETPVREVPMNLDQTWVTLMGKSYSTGPDIIPSAENVIDLPIFHGLGVHIVPSNTTWFDSFRPATGHTQLISVTTTAAYDHLFMQQTIPPGSAEVFYVDGKLFPQDASRNDMFKLHDGARLVYRQPWAGPNRFEVYDSHVHSVIGTSVNGRLDSQVGPTAVSVYGDDVYYFFKVSDRQDPRAFKDDPYMSSWGYGDFVATTYVGGREDKTLLHSLVTSNDRTRTRIALDNNTGVTLTNVSVNLLMPDWISATTTYTVGNAPEPIWPELSFLNATTIPDAWRGVYYFDLTIGDVPTDVVGTVITLPVQLHADGLPAGYEVPPLVLAIKDVDGGTPKYVSGLAHDLTLTQTVPSNVSIDGAAVINAQEYFSLRQATDYDANHLLSATARNVFTSFTHLISFTNNAGVIDFDLPANWRTLPQTQTLYVTARATITQANHGPNTISDGGTICYTDSFGARWCNAHSALIVEATGAAVSADYQCLSVNGVTVTQCTVSPDQISTLNLKVTVTNNGDKKADAVSTTLQLPPGVTPAVPVAHINWGDIAPGSWSSKVISVEVQPQAAAIVAGPMGWQWPIVLRTTGQFTDTASARVISGQFGGAYAINVAWKPRYVYLPVIFQRYDARPDLIVQAIHVTPNNTAVVEVQIVNRGLGVAPAGFWLDVYLDPSTPPTVNHPWETLSFYGLAWQINRDLLPGQVMTITLPATTGRWPATYPGGAHAVWAYVDAWSSPNPIGWVDEAREDNNAFGPVSFTANNTSPAWLPLLLIDVPDPRR